ncbi:MAG: hypothetical protein ACFE9T_16220, partial [Promethearchaeota archaeon]
MLHNMGMTKAIISEELNDLMALEKIEDYLNKDQPKKPKDKTENIQLSLKQRKAVKITNGQ